VSGAGDDLLEAVLIEVRDLHRKFARSHFPANREPEL